MEISLIRHGKSTLTDSRTMTGEELQKWVKQYDEHGVVAEDVYPHEAVNKIQTAHLVLTSDLRRSIESAKLLNDRVNTISMPVFRETELPASFLKGVKLPANLWVILLRCLWFSGYSRGCESIFQAKQRAQKAAQLLIDYAQEHEAVVLVGHGFFNMFIAKELVKKGWTGQRKAGSKHWECTTYFNQ